MPQPVTFVVFYFLVGSSTCSKGDIQQMAQQWDSIQKRSWCAPAMTLETWFCAEVHSKIWFVWAKHFSLPTDMVVRWWHYEGAACQILEQRIQKYPRQPRWSNLSSLHFKDRYECSMSTGCDMGPPNQYNGGKNSTIMMWKWPFVNAKRPIFAVMEFLYSNQIGKNYSMSLGLH